MLCCSLQVLEQLQLLQDQVALTYSEARAAAKQQEEPWQQEQCNAGLQCQPTLSSSAGHGQRTTDPALLHHNSHYYGSSRQPGAGSNTTAAAGTLFSSNGNSSNASKGSDAGNDMLMAFVAELRGAADDEGAAAAAAAALSEMREWVAQQDMRMVEVRHSAAAEGGMPQWQACSHCVCY